MIFIRPFFLLLLLVPFMTFFFKSSQFTKSPWTKWVDKKLLPHLLVGSNRQKFSLWRFSLITLWSLCVIAVAGPAFQKISVPTTHTLPNTVIIFDLGPPMRDNSLATAKIKLHDLLTALKGNRVGLVLYADKGYTALPLTEDRAILRSLIATLDSSVLPNEQQNLASAFQQANELIQQSGGKGRILYITAGGVDARGINTQHPVGVLGIDDHAVSMALKQLGTYRAKTTDASDILALLKATEPDTVLQFKEDTLFDSWADLAPYIILLLLPFFAFTFRRGFLFMFLLCFFTSAHASFFLRPDQQAYKEQQKAVADYRAGNYEKAIKGFQNHPYNLGNALAFSGKIQEAIQAYTQALKENPEDEDARFNKEYLEKQLPPQETTQQNQKQEQQKNNSSNQEEQNSDSDQQQENQEESSQQNNTDKTEETQSITEQSDKHVQPEQTEEANQNLPQEVDEEQREQSPFNQEEQKLLNRIKTDPYRVLRYRIQQQARKK